MANKKNQYKPEPIKGETEDGNNWICWDAVRTCRQKECPIYSVCKYSKKPGSRCMAEIKYINSIFKSISSHIGKDMDQLLLNKISLHLIPLFHQLIILKIEAYNITEVVYTNKHGGKKINPIFKEIREVISSIEKTQRSMGIDGEYMNTKAFALRLKGIGPNSKSLEAGEADLGYYETLLENDKKDIATDINPKHNTKYDRVDYTLEENQNEPKEDEPC